MSNCPYNKKSLLFAPMEGVTDPAYRKVVGNYFPEWDYYSTDFLRVPSVGHYSSEKILDHFGKDIYNSDIKKKTTFQILTTLRANTEHTLKQIEDLGFSHIDLNLGCPSRKVNSHFGGSYLLSDCEKLEDIIKIIRKSFKGSFTAKIRTGYRNTDNFDQTIKILESEGVDAITIHGRTRDELYKGVANWDYIKRAVEISSIPIIGNGDIWTVEDIDKMFEYTNCHSVMLGRGAMKTPWLATLYKSHKNEANSLEVRSRFIEIYFSELKKSYQERGLDEVNTLKRFKALSRYIFDDYPTPEQTKRNFMRSKTFSEFNDHLTDLLS